ncbi:hypothetical protein AGDE_02186 [Angomonas deanei]|uniref:Uncharacterized protein n=1 Tax=Angomonas deanei TaxID=59799 RepID=A0A7G2CAD6_9TRYP|nr:hypothetical protein AGDE_02186 [Angomonas deanei]CAD2216519.1 hypothetical protein, conserved [Angomonas deanei]|eukprot:EPY41738.1 hypothetical protein AGDE_02186 [Angomonas deanei]
MNSPSLEGWKEVDTSYCDVGDLEEDMPTEVDEILQKSSVTAASGESSVEVDATTLQQLHASFLHLCKEYVLMDTSGMKNSMTYTELNNGPDYEMFDRKSARVRHWLSIRHRFEDVRTLLWPTEPGDGEGAAVVPSLSAAEMLQSLVWLEAASTFCVRKYHPYHFAGKEDFLPLDLHREVTALSEQVRREGGGERFFSASEGAEDLNTIVNRFISSSSLCLHHNVKLSSFFRSGTEVDALVRHIPPILRVKDAIRVMAVLTAMEDTNIFRFSDAAGTVTESERLQAFARLCSPTLFGEQDALRNVDESELCTLMTFLVHLKEQNKAFFHQTPADFERDRANIQRAIQAGVARCQYLLYKLGGPQTVVMSDEENIPFVEAQKYAEHAHKDVQVHGKVGIENAQGLRFALLGPRASAILSGLLQRLEATGAETPSSQLVADLVQHIAHRTALGKGVMHLADIIHVLPLLAKLIRDKPETDVRRQYERLFSAVGHSIAVELQKDCSTESVVALLEGLAECRFIPSSFSQIEMVLTRKVLREETTMPQLSRVLSSLLQLTGREQISPVLLECACSVLGRQTPEALGASPAATEACVDLLRVMRFCRFEPFVDVLRMVWRDALITADTLQTPSTVCAYATVLSFLAASGGDQEEELYKESKRTLERGLSMWEGLNTSREKDILLDSLISAWVLRVEKQPIMEKMAEERYLHSLVSPLQAVYLLGALEGIGLVRCDLYRVYEAYLEQHIAGLTTSQQLMEEEDASSLILLLDLKVVKEQLVLRAGALLAREVRMLDRELTRVATVEDASSSGEKAHLLRSRREAAHGEKILLYCQTLSNNTLTKRLVEELQTD